MRNFRTAGSGHGIGRHSLTLELAIAFAIVALAAVAMLSLLTAVMASGDVQRQDTMRRHFLTGSLAVVAAATFQDSHALTPVGLDPVTDLAARAGAYVAVLDKGAFVVTATHGFAHQSHKMQFTASIRAHGVDVGKVVTRFTSGGGIGTTGGALEASLLRGIVGGTGVAALLALAAGIIAARIITRPLVLMIATIRARGSGARGARVGSVRAPAEIGELAAAFDDMAEKIDRQERLRRDLVADVAHELRTPVAILQAGHEALLDGVAEPTPEELGSLRDEVLRLARMVSDLQEMAAAEAAALHLQLVRCDLAAIAASAADSLEGRMEAAGLTFERNLDLVEVMGDARWLHNVLSNLLTNALKYTPGGGMVNLTAGPSPDGKDAVATVTDTGIGVPADELPHIFERFWRGRQAAQTAGSGIGLAMVEEIVHAHDGHLAATSIEGQGMQMTLCLPRV